MIEGVSNAVPKVSSPFAKRKSDYFILPETSKDIFETQEKNNNKKGMKVGLIIAGISLTAALAVFAVMKGLPKNTYKYLQDAAQKLEEKVKSRKLRGEKGAVTSFYKYSLEKLKSFAEKSRSINNFTSIKDLLFKKIMAKTKPTKKIHEGTTVLFEKLARNTVNRAYAKTNKRFTKMFQQFSKTKSNILKNPNGSVEINGVSKSAGEWIRIADEKLAVAERSLTAGFGENARLSRYSDMKAANIGIDEKVSEICLNGVNNLKEIKENVKLLKESPVSKTFVAQDILEPDKLLIRKNVMAGKDAINFNDVMEIYEKLLPKNEVKKLKGQLQKSMKSLDKAIHTETELFFDKLRDMSLGSAPTDVLTVLGAIGGVGLGLTRAEGKDEKMSAVLRYGIPVIGSVAASLAMTVCLVSGFKALAGGLISGFIMNRVGEIVDKYRIRKQKEIQDLKNAENIKSLNAKKE